MVLHKLHINEFDETDYQLIAIHTTLEDYRLAYFLNQKLPVLLAKSKNDIAIYHKEAKATIPHFFYEDETAEITWNLVPNQTEIEISQENSNDLFNNQSASITTKIYLLPEFKKVDFLLKIEPSETNKNIQNTIAKLNTIDKITTVYIIDNDQIKSKNNLIF
jgi:hypothetical protein